MHKEISIIRTFGAPREKVWKAWTDPQALAEWWGPKGVTNPECEVDLQVGGMIRIVMLAGPELGPMAGQRWPMKGRFVEINAPEKLVFTNQAVDEQDNALLDGLTTVVLQEEAGGTKMTLTSSASGDAPQVPQMLEGMEQGWTESINKLETYLKS